MNRRNVIVVCRVDQNQTEPDRTRQNQTEPDRKSMRKSEIKESFSHPKFPLLYLFGGAESVWRENGGKVDASKAGAKKERKGRNAVAARVKCFLGQTEE